MQTDEIIEEKLLPVRFIFFLFKRQRLSIGQGRSFGNAEKLEQKSSSR